MQRYNCNGDTDYMPLHPEDTQDEVSPSQSTYQHTQYKYPQSVQQTPIET